MSRLHIINGSYKGQSFNLAGQEVIIGRSSDSDIQIKDLSVSRSHLQILKKSNKLYAKDLGTTNGTFIHGNRIEPETEIEIKEGLPIVIGKIMICLGKVDQEEQTSVGELTDLTSDFSVDEVSSKRNRPKTPQKNMELFYRVSDVLMKSLNINESLEKILTYLFDILKRIDRAVFILVDDKSGDFSKVIIRLKRSADKKVSMYSRTIVEQVLREGKAITIPNTLGEGAPDHSESMQIMNVQSVMCVPLISRSKVRGVIYVDSVTSPYGFRKEDLALLTALATPAAIAIDNANLYSVSSRLAMDENE
jgi:3',5'-cyclic-nucleotide phosphodiesterase